MPRFLRQFGLRTLLLFCTLAAVCFGFWRSHMTWVERQHAIAEQIGEKNGSVRWGTWGPNWLHDAFGSRYFSYIIMVDWQHKLIVNQDLELLRELTSLEELDVAGNRISNKQPVEFLRSATLLRLGRLLRCEFLDISSGYACGFTPCTRPNLNNSLTKQKINRLQGVGSVGQLAPFAAAGRVAYSYQ